MTSIARFFLPLCLGLLVGACASSRYSTLEPSPPHAKINRILAGETAQIRFVDGSRVKTANNVMLAADSVYYEREDSQLYSLSGESLTVRALNDVEMISYIPHSKAKALGLMALVPGMSLALYTYFKADCNSGGGYCELAKVYVVFLSAAAGAVGAILGSLVGGAFENHVIVYAPEGYDQ